MIALPPRIKGPAAAESWDEALSRRPESRTLLARSEERRRPSLTASKSDRAAHAALRAAAAPIASLCCSSLGRRYLPPCERSVALAARLGVTRRRRERRG